MIKYQETLINSKPQKKIPVKNLKQQRLNKMLKNGLLKYDFLPIDIDDTGKIRMVHVKIVDKDTEYAIRHYNPLRKTAFAKVIADKEIYYIVPSTSIDFTFGQYLELAWYRTTREFDYMLHHCQIINGKFYMGTRPKKELPPVITAIPQNKICCKCHHSFLANNNKQKMCKDCYARYYRERLNAFMSKYGLVWDYDNFKWVRMIDIVKWKKKYPTNRPKCTEQEWKDFNDNGCSDCN